MNICKSLADYTVKKVKKYVELDQKQEARVIYGLYCLYSNFLKIPLVFIVGHLAGLLTETTIFLVTFALLRTFSFGTHAEKSWICTLTNFTVFNLGTYVSIKISFSWTILIGMIIFSFSSFLLYAPADTKARPLKDKIKRKKLKIKTLIVFCSITVIAIFIDNYDYTKLIVISSFVQSVNILPITYRVLRKPYRNYLMFE